MTNQPEPFTPTPGEQPDRALHWDACLNARDVGGYPTSDGGQTAWRALIRTDNHYSLTRKGQADLCGYGISTVIDLRMPNELDAQPNPFSFSQSDPNSPRYLHRTIQDQDDRDAFHAMVEASSLLDEYIIMIERNKPRIAAAVKAVAESLPMGGVVVHCRGGKDRTGIVVALLLSIAGVPRDLIIEDYAISSPNLEPMHQRWLAEQSAALGQPIPRPRWMDSTPETMEGTLEHIDRMYGGVGRFLVSIGVTQDEIDTIRQYLVETA